ncbi:MAG: hypothetical protein ACJASN_003277, partial [Cyclobacteriaceae bacterium]
FFEATLSMNASICCWYLAITLDYFGVNVTI